MRKICNLKIYYHIRLDAYFREEGKIFGSNYENFLNIRHFQRDMRLDVDVLHNALLCCVQGSKIFRAKADDHILGGDFENDDGTGGHSAYDEKYFLAEQCPLKVP